MEPDDAGRPGQHEDPPSSRSSAVQSRTPFEKTRSHKSWQRDNLSAEETEKLTIIEEACEEPVDLIALTALATSPHGLVDDGVRRVACRSTELRPQLLG